MPFESPDSHTFAMPEVAHGYEAGKEVYYINFGGQLYQGVSDHLKGSKPVPGQLYCLQKLIRDRLEVAHGQFWSQEAAEGQARGFIYIYKAVCGSVSNHPL